MIHRPSFRLNVHQQPAPSIGIQCEAPLKSCLRMSNLHLSTRPPRAPRGPNSRKSTLALRTFPCASSFLHHRLANESGRKGTRFWRTTGPVMSDSSSFHRRSPKGTRGSLGLMLRGAPSHHGSSGSHTHLWPSYGTWTAGCVLVR